jgi:hypothetical protein
MLDTNPTLIQRAFSMDRIFNRRWIGGLSMVLPRWIS